jgi:hypothetical protein
LGNGTKGEGITPSVGVVSLGVPMSAVPHVPRHRTGHIRGLISTERTHPQRELCPRLSVYWQFSVKNVSSVGNR